MDFSILTVTDSNFQVCVNSSTVAGDIVDNDCDDLIDEESLNGIGKLELIFWK